MGVFLYSLLDLDEQYLERAVNYPFEGYDFIIGRDKQLYFIEANSVPGGLSVITTVYKILKKHLPPKLLRAAQFYDRLVLDFAEMSVLYHIFTKNYYPENVIVTVPKERRGLLSPERAYIAWVFQKLGLKSKMVFTDEIYADGNIIVHKDRFGNEIIPDIIVRRTFNFPKNIIQTVINPSEIGKITGNKWKSYQIVRDLIRHNDNLRNIVKVPLTFHAKNSDHAIGMARELIEMGKEVIIKPTNGMGGKGILYISSENELEKKKLHIKERTKYVVQEKIDCYPFISTGNNIYAFDVRAYGFMGNLMALQIRRASMPLTIKKIGEDSIVSNISRGGTFVFVIEDSNFNGFIKFLKIEKKKLALPHRIIDIDNSVVLVGKQLIDKIRLAVKMLTMAFSGAVGG